MSDTVHPLMDAYCADLLADVEADRAKRLADAVERHPAGSRLPSPEDRVAAFDERNERTKLRLIQGGQS